MSILAEPSLLQDEVQVFNAIGPDCDNALQLDIANLSDNCPDITLQMLEVWLCQWSNLTGMEHFNPHTRAVHMVTS